MCSRQLRWLGDAITWQWNGWLCGQWLASRDLDVATLFSSEKSWDVSRGSLLMRFQVCCSVLCLVLRRGTITAMLFLLVGNCDFLMKHLSQRCAFQDVKAGGVWVVGWSDLKTEFSRPAEMSGLISVTWLCTSDELAAWKCERSRT
ncbi:hypothetical protein G5714_020860 [Onychostoma macrolepis]|uniref:Uncharacterized protein n=1 Tax=Onychostoma macrolepis TaxID=369639 RepID=A0A7J6BV15_9TELE|nr:hypothetical protein G5714_020860 [Onychostoma macrolepis]